MEDFDTFLRNPVDRKSCVSIVNVSEKQSHEQHIGDYSLKKFSELPYKTKRFPNTLFGPVYVAVYELIEKGEF